MEFNLFETLAMRVVKVVVEVTEAELLLVDSQKYELSREDAVPKSMTCWHYSF